MSIQTTISTANTFDMHQLSYGLGAIREKASGWIAEDSRLGSASVGRAFLRSIKLAPPGAYRMPVRRPNLPAEELEHTSQRYWLIACDPLLHPLSMMGVKASA
jgi:hypothetical protein